MAENLPASDVVYAILSERLGAEDAGCIDRLEGEAFIYDAELKCFLKADRVFWNPTYFRGHWHLASSRMRGQRSEEHTSELQSLMRISYAVFCLKKKT